MAKEKTKKTRGLAIAAGVLAVVIGVGAVVGVGYSTNWFRKTDEVVDVTVSEENQQKSVMVSNGESKGIKLLSATNSSITNGDGNSATYCEDSVDLTVSYNEYATNPSFTWSCTDTANITITPSSDTKSCTVTINYPFSTQATITCTANNSSAYATCTVDYIKRASGFRLTLSAGASGNYDYISWSSSGTSATWTLPTYTEITGDFVYYSGSLSLSSYTPKYKIGTITETYSVYEATAGDSNTIDLMGGSDIW